MNVIIRQEYEWLDPYCRDTVGTLKFCEKFFARMYVTQNLVIKFDKIQRL